jgi:hypothetical protein
MKRQLAAALFAALFFSACGGGGGGDGSGGPGSGSGSGSGNDGISTPTEVGTPLGIATSKVIGAAGGQLTSADGTLTVEVPAGAFASDQTLSIQEITNKAHGAHGRAFRITPEGLHSDVPMTLRFRYTDDDLAGSALAYLSIAYQDAQRRWRVYQAPAVDEANKVLSVQTKHFSDWSMVAGAQIIPNKATVRVGQSLALQVMSCEQAEYEDLEGEFDVPTVGYDCMTSPLDSFSTGHWAVNGVEGGGGRFGTVVPDAERGKATYTAPATKPEPNLVSVSAQHRFPFEDTLQLLVATIAIEDEPPGCEGLRSVERFDADVSFDAFDFTATAEYHTHSGQHAGRLIGSLSKIDTGPTLGLWVTYLSPLKGGQVSISDSYRYDPPSDQGYTGTVTGSGAPHDGLDAPSFVALTVHYDTCTFDLIASYTIDATIVHDGSARSSLMGIGGMGIYGQAISAEQAAANALQGSLAINAVDNIEQNRTGYAPFKEAALERSLTGATTARWTITPAP